MHCASNSNESHSRQGEPVAPILICTPDSNDTSADSSPSECSEHTRGWPRSATGNAPYSSSTIQHTASKDTASATSYHGYSYINKPATVTAPPTNTNDVDFSDLLTTSQIKTGAPGQAPSYSTNSCNATDSAVILNRQQPTIYNNASGKRRLSSSYDSRIPYRQSSLKWKQRNGSATFELKLSQEEFMSRHSTVVFAD